MNKPNLTVLNIDESHITEVDFRRMKWQPRGSTNSIPVKQVAPRISMIVAIYNWGKVYLSCTQVNTDSKVMSLYFRELVKVLDKGNLDWRKTTVLMIDGAKYH